MEPKKLLFILVLFLALYLLSIFCFYITKSPYFVKTQYNKNTNNYDIKEVYWLKIVIISLIPSCFFTLLINYIYAYKKPELKPCY